MLVIMQIKCFEEQKNFAYENPPSPNPPPPATTHIYINMHVPYIQKLLESVH